MWIMRSISPFFGLNTACISLIINEDNARVVTELHTGCNYPVCPSYQEV